ncbi:MAG: extracellular solute-binding protein [Gemmiger sp.]|nr:extracellular solute-binding protein [Gemmiger sp.]
MKKVLASAMAVAMAASLAACGSTGTAASTPSSTASSADTATSTAASATADTGAELSGKVVYWSMWTETEPQAEILKTAITAFEAANPGCTVEVEWTGRGVKDLISAAVASGQQVDIFDSDPANLYKADPTVLMDLTDFYASDSLAGGPESENVMKGLIDYDKGLSSIYADGKNYSVPYNPYTITWFYNTEMFADAGITAVPTTWEELDAACAKLKDAGYEPITTDDAYFTMMFQYYMERMMGEDAIRAMCDQGGDAWKNDQLKQTLTALEDFATKGYFSTAIKTNAYPAGQQQFARKEAAMYFNASFMASENAETAGADFPYGEFAFTAVPGGISDTSVNTLGGQAFMVNANTENKAATYALLHYFVGSDCQNGFTQAGLTACNNTAEWPAAVKDQQAIVAGTTKTINWGAGFGGDFWDAVVTPTVQKVMLGEVTAQAAFDTITTEAANY